MDSEYLQYTRYKLQKRLKRLNTAEYNEFHETLVQCWAFLTSSPLTNGLLEDLRTRHAEKEVGAENVLQKKGFEAITESEHVALSYWVVQKCATTKRNDVEIQVGHSLGHVSKHDEAIEIFRRNFVEPLFDYLDEQIDDQRITLALLRKFKHRVEWFDRDRLRQIYQSDTRRGEKNLSKELYAYLHDQGLEFSIEPASVSGEADLVSAQRGDQRLVADAKVFDPATGKDKRHVRSGFAQIYQYTKDYHDLFGFLLIFKLCQEDLAVSAPKLASGFPVFTHNNKSLFVVVIDIFDYAKPASQRGPLKTYELTTAEMIEAAEAANPTLDTVAEE